MFDPDLQGCEGLHAALLRMGNAKGECRGEMQREDAKDS
jgi:hypothetical protein